jgi:hypothetical protein
MKHTVKALVLSLIAVIYILSPIKDTLFLQCVPKCVFVRKGRNAGRPHIMSVPKPDKRLVSVIEPLILRVVDYRYINTII